MGKIFQKKKWFRGRHTTEEERRKKKVWPKEITSHINIIMAKASPEDLKALFDTQQGYDDVFQCS